MRKIILLSAVLLQAGLVAQWTEGVSIISTMDNVGIGTANPISKLHLYNGASGRAPHGFADLAIEDDGPGMVSILSPNTENAYYGFADTDDDFVAGIQYYHPSDIMYFRVNNHASDMVITKDGNVGIGTTTPSERLRISTGTSGDAILTIEADTDNNDEYDNPMIKLRQDGGAIGVNIGYSEENFGGNIFGIGTRHSHVEKWDTFSINTASGNVGIGTKNAGAWKLAVKGKIRAEEIKVETSWSDYVFAKDYDLPTLKEVEQHIAEKGHLINIPSAKEVEENGILLGEMNKLLLEKIEELTLYTLQQQKALEEQKSKNQDLEKRLGRFESELQALKNYQLSIIHK